ncbi:MAG: FAD binding domain-containing protein [Desulfomonilaceae bacterium]
MNAKFQYLRPDSLEECLSVLANRGSETAILAGGTDLMISLRKGSRTPKLVVDISRLNETRLVERESDAIRVGSTLTYSDLIVHPLVASDLSALTMAMNCVGSPQIRNAGTLGGNIANSSPAADSVPAMMVFEAEIMIQKADASRIEKLEKIIVGPYSNTLEPDELITKIIFKPVEQSFRQSYRRVSRRRSLSIARVNAAVLGKKNSDGFIEDVRISVGSVAPIPLRIKKVEDSLKNFKPGAELFKDASDMVARQIIELVGLRQSTEYKRPAIAGLVFKCLEDVFID